MYCQIVDKRQTAPSSGHFRWPVDWVWDSCRSSVLLTDPTCLFTFQKIKVLIRFFIVFYHNYLHTIFTHHYCKKNIFEIFKTNLQVLTDCWRPCDQTKRMKGWGKLTIETRSQKLCRMAGLGLKIRRRMLTNCCSCDFLALFFKCNLRPNTPIFSTIWDHITIVIVYVCVF